MFETSLCPSRDDPLNKILDFISEQTKHTGMHLLCYDEIMFCPFVLEDATLAINLSLLQHSHLKRDTIDRK